MSAQQQRGGRRRRRRVCRVYGGGEWLQLLVQVRREGLEQRRLPQQSEQRGPPAERAKLSAERPLQGGGGTCAGVGGVEGGAQRTQDGVGHVACQGRAAGRGEQPLERPMLQELGEGRRRGRASERSRAEGAAKQIGRRLNAPHCLVDGAGQADGPCRLKIVQMHSESRLRSERAGSARSDALSACAACSAASSRLFSAWHSASLDLDWMSFCWQEDVSSVSRGPSPTRRSSAVLRCGLTDTAETSSESPNSITLLCALHHLS